MIDVHEHEHLAGPSAADAAQRMAEFGQRARFRGIVVSDDRQLQRLMQKNDPAVYPGEYVTCIFSAGRAPCLRQQGARVASAPSLPNCQPFDCRNVAMTADNKTAFLGEVNTIDKELSRRPPLPPLLHARLSARRDQIVAFLDRYPDKP